MMNLVLVHQNWAQFKNSSIIIGTHFTGISYVCEHGLCVMVDFLFCLELCYCSIANCTKTEQFIRKDITFFENLKLIIGF